ncbi:hypothetical protein R1flu_007964 [Riccia fluitans]|uniref:Uncharacterized protein n=1 Tax=Riccia fluitans TaxID=41844 RepID=A0ABD1YE10_9MARC
MQGVTEAEGGVSEPEAGNMEGEEGVTKAEGGITEAEAGNMEAEEGVTEVDGGVMEADLEEAMEAEGGVTEPHLEEDADHEGGVTEAEEVAREMECVAGHNIVHQLRSMVPFGKWYFVFQKKLKGPKFIYVEAKKDPVVIYSHLVRAVKIRMASMPPMGKQQDTACFSIDNETHKQILATYRNRKHHNLRKSRPFDTDL